MCIDDFDDKITTLFRARLFGSDLESAVNDASSRGEPLSLLMIDIDRFKNVNDTHGHLIGDEVLRSCGEVIAKRVRGKGKAYRYGGEEITVLLPNFSVREGLAVAEESRAAMEMTPASSMKLHVTVSVGLACLPDHGSHPDGLIALADKAMYQGKELGRNLVRVSGEPVEYNPVVRNINRREPRPDPLSESEKDNIRKTYFRRVNPECPKDGTFLRIRESNTIGSRTPTLIVSCPMCGLQEILHGS